MSMNANAMIRARGLKRQFKSRKGVFEAVKGIDLEVAAGEIIGFLGPNGAGKTTTLKMLSTLLEPSGGAVTVAGVDLLGNPREVRRRIGYVPQSGSTFGEARAGDEIVWQGELYGLSKSEAKARGQDLLAALDLPDIWMRKCKTLSGGQRRRLDIVMGLLHRPRLVFLDEPTTGLDPQSRANLWAHIRSLRDKWGTTVFLTTHYMDEADSLSDRILIIDHGEIVASGTPSQLKQSTGGDVITLTLPSPDAAEQAARVCASLGGATAPATEADLVRVQVENAPGQLPKLMAGLAENKLEALGVEIARPTLDDVFLSLTGRSLREH